MFDENGRLELGWDDVIFYPWSAVGANLSDEINSIRYVNEGFDSISFKDKKAKNLGNLKGNLIFMGHGNATAKAIAGGGEEGNRSRPVGDLARVLQKMGTLNRLLWQRHRLDLLWRSPGRPSPASKL